MRTQLQEIKRKIKKNTTGAGRKTRIHGEQIWGRHKGKKGQYTQCLKTDFFIEAQENVQPIYEGHRPPSLIWFEIKNVFLGHFYSRENTRIKFRSGKELHLL
jgi:hypothetical protein